MPADIIISGIPDTPNGGDTIITDGVDIGWTGSDPLTTEIIETLNKEHEKLPLLFLGFIFLILSFYLFHKAKKIFEYKYKATKDMNFKSVRFDKAVVYLVAPALVFCYFYFETLYLSETIPTKIIDSLYRFQLVEGDMLNLPLLFPGKFYIVFLCAALLPLSFSIYLLLNVVLLKSSSPANEDENKTSSLVVFAVSILGILANIVTILAYFKS